MRKIWFLPTSLLYALLFFSLSACSGTFFPHSSSENLHSRTTASESSTSTVTLASASDLEILYQGRIDAIIGSQKNPNIPLWLSLLGEDGKWSDVNYATGCAAQRANWPAQEHWSRLVGMASAWHGGLPNADEYVGNATLGSIISTSMDWWFDRDFQNSACLTEGGTSSCPCDASDQTLWNTNWFSNVIGTPMQVAATCLLMENALTPTQLNNCTHMTARSYGTFQGSFGFLAGANILDIAKIGIDNGILNQNISLITDAYQRIHNEVRIQPGVRVDGIKADGSFGQHTGLLYNGNYGKDYTNDVLDLEIAAAGTQFAADSTSKSAMELLFDGDSWMTYRNTRTGVLHWDFSALGRFISFPVADSQATASINLNLTKIGQLGVQWQSDTLTHFAQLSQDASGVNAGQLVGNRHFYANDYIVHRGGNYVSTVKMFSKRTTNTECTNSQNPLGFHLADGAQYNYLVGDEYEDIAASWDWNLIPGTTTDYAATPLNCGKAGASGIESFVGGASTGTAGLAAMRYTNPNTKSLQFQKTWFFLGGDVQYVMISNINSTTKAQVYSVLDQRRHAGPIVVDAEEVTLEENKVTNFTNVSTLWHGGMGYSFETNNTATLSLGVGPKTGNWSQIGISSKPPTTVDLYAAWLRHTTLGSSIAYSVFPGTTVDAFVQRKNAVQLHAIQNDGAVSALFDKSTRTIMVVYWSTTGGCVVVDDAAITICSSSNAAIIYDIATNAITVSDPSQTLSSVVLKFTTSSGNKTVSVSLPTGGEAGKSVSQTLV